jgi:hypothetical protein
METPASMRAELDAWNNGAGVDLETWAGCEGRFALAVGYAALLWPELELVEGYLVHAGTTAGQIRSFAEQPGATRPSVEAVLNHLHLADLQYVGCADCTADKLLALGKALKEMHEAKLAWQFPDRPCTVELYIPDDVDALRDYQITFWQNGPESAATRPQAGKP